MCVPPGDMLYSAGGAPDLSMVPPAVAPPQSRVPYRGCVRQVRASCPSCSPPTFHIFPHLSYFLPLPLPHFVFLFEFIQLSSIFHPSLLPFLLSSLSFLPPHLLLLSLLISYDSNFFKSLVFSIYNFFHFSHVLSATFLPYVSYVLHLSILPLHSPFPFLSVSYFSIGLIFTFHIFHFPPLLSSIFHLSYVFHFSYLLHLFICSSVCTSSTFLTSSTPFISSTPPISTFLTSLTLTLSMILMCSSSLISSSFFTFPLSSPPVLFPLHLPLLWLLSHHPSFSSNPALPLLP